MNKKLRKILVPLGTLATVATVATAVSCGGDKTNSSKGSTTGSEATTQNNSALLKNKVYVTLVNDKYTPTAYLQDASTGTGSRVVNMDLNLNNSSFITTKILTNPEYNVTDTTTKLLQAGTWALHLGYASAILLTVDGQVKVYDKDTYTVPENVPTNEAVDGYYQLKSDDASSINNPQFEKDLAKATNLQLEVRKDVQWVNSNGDVVKNADGKAYTVTAQDFVAGWQRTLAFTQSAVLSSYGGTNEMNAAMNTSNGSTITAFSGKNNVDNTYVYRLYGVEPNNFTTKNFVTEKDGNSYLNFTAVSGKTPDYTALLQQLSSSYDFVPVPYEWIQDQNKKGDKVLQSLVASALPAMKTAYAKLNKESLAYKLGVYWYGYNAQTTLSSGPYYDLPYDGNNNQQVYKLNTHYYDQEYVKDPTTLLEFQQKYQQTQQSPDEYVSALFNGVKTGIYSRGAWQGLTDKQRLEIVNDKSQFQVAYSNVITTDKQTENIFFTLNPLDQTGDTNLYTSDAYTQLMFGAKQANVEDQTVSNPIKVATSGQALEFRTILESALNWQSYVSQLRKNYGRESIPWLNPFAFNVPINGKDATTSNETTPRQNYYKLNRTFVVNSEGAKVKFDALTPNEYNGQGTYLSAVSDSSSEVGATSGNILNSVVYKQLQTQMTKLLDDFYAKHTDLNPSTAEGKMVVQIPTPYSYPQNIVDVLKQICSTWNGLDTKGRLEFKLKLLGEKNKNEFWNSMGAATNPWAWGSWGYDYKGLTSGFDGLSIYGFNYIYFNEIADSKYTTTLAKSFPELAKVGDYLKQYMTEHKVVLRVRTNSDYSTDTSEVTEWTESSNGDYATVLSKVLSLPLKDQVAAQNELVKDSQIGLLTAEFWKWMSTQLTKDQLIKMMNEVSMVLTPFPAVLYRTNSFAITMGLANDDSETAPQPGKPLGTVVYNSTVTPSLYLQGYSVPYSFDTSWGIGLAYNLKLKK